MKKIRNNIFISLFLISVLSNIAFAQNDSLLEPKKEINIQNKIQNNTNPNYFNLANIVDNFLKNENTNEKNIEDDDEKSQIRKDFISITSKFNQGNAKSAYDNYNELIDKTDNDIALLNLSKVFYKIGFFSLANKSIDKIIYKNQYYNNIYDLERTYKPKASLSLDEEIYFAKLYSSIYFDNSASEANLELLSKKDNYQKNDYYHYFLSQSYFELKDYQKALNSINKSISLNSENINYKILKLDILTAFGKYSDANNLIKKLEKDNLIIDLKDDILIKKQNLIVASSKNDKEKKYAAVYKTFLEGNYEKTKKDCLSILNFDKNNDKIISLYAKSELALGNIERANVYFVNAYKIEKNNQDTIIGLGDIRYIHKDYKNSIKMYKKALKNDRTNFEIILKLASAQREFAKNPKELKKTEALLDKYSNNAYLEYYNAAISIAQKNSVLKEDFLKRSLNISPMYKNAIGELIELNLKNKNYINAKGLINSASLTLEKNYYYYYLCGLYNQAKNKKQDAIQFYKTSLNLNPNFEIANRKLLNLIPSKNEEI